MAKRTKGPDLSQLHLGLEFVGGTLLFALLGWWLDGVFGTEPWLVLVGGGLGFSAGMYLLVKEAMKANRAAAAKFGKSGRAVETPAVGKSTKGVEASRHDDDERS